MVSSQTWSTPSLWERNTTGNVEDVCVALRDTLQHLSQESDLRTDVSPRPVSPRRKGDKGPLTPRPRSRSNRPCAHIARSMAQACTHKFGMGGGTYPADGHVTGNDPPLRSIPRRGIPPRGIPPQSSPRRGVPQRDIPRRGLTWTGASQRVLLLSDAQVVAAPADVFSTCIVWEVV